MARLAEYQGKKILQEIGVSVPRGKVVESAFEAREAAKEIGKPVALKAQVLATGRFKAGGIKFAQDAQEAERIAQELLGSAIKGLQVKRLLVEEKLDVAKEFYVGVIINNSYKVKAPTVILSSEGGVDIEEVAQKSPEKVARFNVDYLTGVGREEASQLVRQLAPDESLPPPVYNELLKVICSLYRAFKEYDLRIAEINPLILTREGSLLAGDCRFTIDDSSVFRHPEFGIRLPRDMDREPTELELIAWAIEEGDFRGTSYFAQMVSEIKEEGYIGFHGIGGGGSMLAASALVNRGFKIANYTDTSGDPPASKIYRVVKCIFAQPIDGYVLMGACLANQEQWHHAHALVKILREEATRRPGFPVVILLAGNKEEQTHEILRNGLRGVPLRWEIYGREHIYNTEFIAERVEELVKAYKKEGR